MREKETIGRVYSNLLRTKSKFSILWGSASFETHCIYFQVFHFHLHSPYSWTDIWTLILSSKARHLSISVKYTWGQSFPPFSRIYLVVEMACWTARAWILSSAATRRKYAITKIALKRRSSDLCYVAWWSQDLWWWLSENWSRLMWESQRRERSHCPSRCNMTH